MVGPYADIIGKMDYRVGQILHVIREAGIEDNNLFYTDDTNGWILGPDFKRGLKNEGM
jgi:arylsulfatase A-like enzyme